MTTFTSGRRKMARRTIKESFDSTTISTTIVVFRDSTNKCKASSTYGRLLDLD